MRTLLAAGILFLSGMALAGETLPPANEPPPFKEGDWFGWRLTVPVDPLEARLADEAEAKENGDAVTIPAAPAAELPQRWRTISCRWEVASVTEAGPVLGIRILSGVAILGTYPARMRGLMSPSMRFTPESDEITVGSAVLNLNGAPLEVRTERWSTAPGVEWERWTSETVPGGLVRMAGPSADLVLVGWGRGGEVPAVPLKDVPTPPVLAVVGKR